MCNPFSHQRNNMKHSSIMAADQHLSGSSDRKKETQRERERERDCYGSVAIGIGI